MPRWRLRARIRAWLLILGQLGAHTGRALRWLTLLRREGSIRKSVLALGRLICFLAILGFLTSRLLSSAYIAFLRRCLNLGNFLNVLVLLGCLTSSRIAPKGPLELLGQSSSLGIVLPRIPIRYDAIL